MHHRSDSPKSGHDGNSNDAVYLRWTRLLDDVVANHEVNHVDRALVSSTHGNLLAYSCPLEIFSSNEVKIASSLAYVQEAVSKLSCGGLRSALSFVDQKVVYHKFCHPIVVSIFSKNDANIALLRSEAAMILESVCGDFSKLQQDAGNGGVSSNDREQAGRSVVGGDCSYPRPIALPPPPPAPSSSSSSSSWEIDLVRHALRGKPIPWNQRRKAWPVLALRMSRLASERGDPVPLVSLRPRPRVEMASSAERQQKIDEDTSNARDGDCDTVPRHVRESITVDVARTYVNEPLFRAAPLRLRRKESRLEQEECGEGRGREDSARGDAASAVDAGTDDSTVGVSVSVGGGGCGGCPGRVLLYELLLDLARTLPEVGYCQGLNFVAALALIVASGAEADPGPAALHAAFSVVLPMIHHVRSLFAPGLPGFHRALALLQQEAVERLPLLCRHLSGEGVALHHFAAPWLQCLFTNPKTPLPLAMHVCELYLVLGFEAIVRVALALLAHEEKGLLALTSVVDMITRLQHATTALAPSQFESLIALGLSLEFSDDTRRRFADIGRILPASDYGGLGARAEDR